jgi:death-on-curing protein
MNSQNDDSHSSENDDRSFYFLSINDLYNINSEVTGKTPFLREHQLLRSVVTRPYIVVFGEEQFPTLIDKAAATMHALAAYHVFADGNKRTAIRATQMFLEANGIRPIWTEDEAREFVLGIAKNEIDLEAVKAWLVSHTESPL